MADTPPAARKLSLATSLVIVALSAVVGFAAVYVTFQRPDNATPSEAGSPTGANVTTDTPSGTAPLPSGPGTNSLSRGDMAAFVFKKSPEAVPAIAFVDSGGAARTLADWKGKTVLLNLWATWCAPCRKEMPALDRLQKELGGEAFEVVALAVDKTGVDGAKKFLDEAKVENLKIYVDPTAKIGGSLRVIGMPTTLLLDREGLEIGRLVGPAEWDGEDAKRLVRAALDRMSE